MSGYSQQKSHLRAQTLVRFLELPWNAPLASVPGIGDRTLGLLTAKGICTILQFAGVFLTFRSPGITREAWHNKIWEYLATVGISGRLRHSIIHSLDEKLAVMIPELHEAEPGAGAVGVDAAGQLVEREPRVLTVEVALTDESRLTLRHVEGTGVLECAAPLDPKLREALLAQCEAVVTDPAAAARVTPVVQGLLEGHGYSVIDVVPTLSKEPAEGEEDDEISMEAGL